MDDNLKREMLVKNSEIRALQNQINAHFIYNVLESIKMMAEIDEEYDISDAVTSSGSSTLQHEVGIRQCPGGAGNWNISRIIWR